MFNAVLGLRQEGKAAAAVAALQRMMIVKARVFRDGGLRQIPAEQLVPGDIVVGRGRRRRAGGRPAAAGGHPGGGRVRADRREPARRQGRRPGAEADTPLGDRSDMVYMNTNVTRGSGEFVVTATGMGTEVGKISGMLAARTRRVATDPAAGPAHPADPMDRRGSPWWSRWP